MFFWACDGNLIWGRDFRVFLGFSGKSCQYLLFENGISLFWFCDGNLWKIMPISSIWKRDRSGTRPEVLLHSPLRGVTRVWASMFYWFYLKKSLQKITKNYSGTKDLQIDDIANIIPMLMVAKCKSSSKDQQSNSNPFNIGMIFAISSIWNCFSCIWDLSNSWGYKWISSTWKQFGGTLWVPSWNIIFYLKSVFQYSSNIFYLKNK